MFTDIRHTINYLPTFLAVVQTGSFTKAAQMLKLSQSTISYQMRILEERVGTTLFQRVGNQLKVTQEGQRLAQQCQTSFEAISAQLETISQSDNYGHFRLTTPQNFGNELIIHFIMELMNTHQDCHIDFIPTDEVLYLATQDIDLAIRFSKHSQLTHQTLVYMKKSLVASPDYVTKHGSINNFADLIEHTLIIRDKDNLDWVHLTQQVPEAGQCEPFKTLEMGSNIAMLSSCREGMGICLLPTYCVIEDLKQGTLVDFLSDSLEKAPTPVYICAPMSTRHQMILQKFSQDFRCYIEESPLKEAFELRSG